MKSINAFLEYSMESSMAGMLIGIQKKVWMRFMKERSAVVMWWRIPS